LKLRIYRVSPDGRVSVAAWTGVAGTNGDGAGISTQLSYPAGMAVDRLGALYVADSGNKLVRRISGGQVTTILTTPGTPVGLAFDREGNLFIADTTSSRLYRRGANGSISTVAGASPALDGPVRDVTVDALGVVCFAVGKQVMKLASNGVPVVIAGTGTNRAIIENSDARLAVLQGPMGVATDSVGNLYIAEERLARVRSVSWTGLIKTVAGGGLPTGLSVGDGGLATDARLVDPVAVAWDPVAGLRVVEYFGNRVRGLFASGKIFTVAGDGEPGYRGDSAPASQARLNRPRAAVFDREGNLYISDSLNHRIRKIGANGFISTVAGSGVRGFYGDGGLATQAQLNSPQGVAVDSLGNIYFADTGNHVVRRVSPEGVLSAVAGTGFRGYSGDGEKRRCRP
jgi:sugar lactone lactonase YvrE